MKFVEYKENRISKLALGTVQFGLNYGIANTHGQPSQKNVDEIIEYVISQKINCFDTAQAYGTSEKVLGSALKDYDNTLIISKFKSDVFRKSSELSIEISLNHLGTTSLFALLLHDSTILYDWNKEDDDKVDNLISNNKIKYFGVSIYSTDDFDLAIKNDKISFIQIPFNLFDQRAYKEKWFEKAKKNNKLIFIRSVYLQGLLLMDQNNLPDNLKKAKKYLEILNLYADKLSLTRNQLALSFVDSIAKDSLILFGCDTLAQAKENIDSYNTLKTVDDLTIKQLSIDLKDIDESIYNPTKW